MRIIPNRQMADRNHDHFRSILFIEKLKCGWYQESMNHRWPFQEYHFGWIPSVLIWCHLIVKNIILFENFWRKFKVFPNHVVKGSFCGRVPDVYFGIMMSCNFRIIERIVRTGKILLNWNRCMIRSGHCFKFCLNYCETAFIRIPTGQTRPR